MATAWIHRALASDILVRYDTIHDAYLFLKTLAENDACETIAPEPSVVSVNGYDIAASETMQYVLVPKNFTAAGWNRDVVVLWPEEAIALGKEEEPAGFVPGETEQPWAPDRRCLLAIDDELEVYMAVGRISEVYEKVLQFRHLFTDDQWRGLQEREFDILEDGTYDQAAQFWKEVLGYCLNRPAPGR